MWAVVWVGRWRYQLAVSLIPPGKEVELVQPMALRVSVQMGKGLVNVVRE